MYYDCLFLILFLFEQSSGKQGANANSKKVEKKTEEAKSDVLGKLVNSCFPSLLFPL